MDQGDIEVYDVIAPPASFFKNIGDQWMRGAGESKPGENIFLTQEQTPLASTIVQEVQHGWTMDTILDFWGSLYFLALLFASGFVISMIYCTVMIFQIRRIEKTALRAGAHPVVAKDTSRLQLRWHNILEKVTADDPQQWRLAVLEADQILNDLLDMLGYKGETMTDKMRKIEVSAFNTIDYAWEAHQIRNRIAQDSSFTLDVRETKRVIKMYERVFKEFKFIPEE